MSTGINIQINTLIDAMIDAERCLFHNSDANLMVNSLLNKDVVSEVVVSAPNKEVPLEFPVRLGRSVISYFFR